jgi:hypothetical protein
VRPGLIQRLSVLVDPWCDERPARTLREHRASCTSWSRLSPSSMSAAMTTWIAAATPVAEGLRVQQA